MSGEGVPDLAPASFSATCSHQPVLCGAPATAPAAPRFDDAGALRLAQKVNGDVNSAMARIGLLINAADDWGPAVTTRDGLVGDCKSFAAEKRRRLIAAGFPAGRLFYAVVFREDIGLHALLMVRLDGGDYAMDSRDPRVVPWRDADYLYVERQAADDPYRWINLVAPPQAVARALMASADGPSSRTGAAPAVLSTTPARITSAGFAALLPAAHDDAVERPLILLALAQTPPRRAGVHAGRPGARTAGVDPAHGAVPPRVGSGLDLVRYAPSPDPVRADGQPVVVRRGPVGFKGACPLGEPASGPQTLDRALAGLHLRHHRLRRAGVRRHGVSRPVLVQARDPGACPAPLPVVGAPALPGTGHSGIQIAALAVQHGVAAAPGAAHAQAGACDCPDARVSPPVSIVASRSD